jgi:hypothetical protein
MPQFKFVTRVVTQLRLDAGQCNPTGSNYMGDCTNTGSYLDSHMVYIPFKAPGKLSDRSLKLRYAALSITGFLQPTLRLYLDVGTSDNSST